LNEPQQDGRRERPQRQHKKWPCDWWVATKEVQRATINFSEEPQTAEKALKGKNAKKWEIAMEEEYNSLVVNSTWSLMPFPRVGSPFLANGCSKSNMGLMVKSNVTRFCCGKRFHPNIWS